MKLQIITQFLMMFAYLLPQATRDLLTSGDIRVQDSTVYVRKQISAGNVTKLVDGNTRKLVGITNIDGNKLEDQRNQLISAISIKYGTHSTITDAGSIDYLSTDIPAALRNAELVIRQGNRTAVSLPISSLIAGKNASPSNVEADRFQLLVMALIVEAQPFTVDLEFPEGADFGVNNHFVEVNFYGAETSKKA